MRVLDRLFAETEGDRRRAAQYRAFSHRTATHADRLRVQRFTPQIIIAVGVLMWLKLWESGGTWFEHGVAVFAVVVGCVLLWVKPGQCGRSPEQPS